jgi:hypothetical protein
MAYSNYVSLKKNGGMTQIDGIPLIKNIKMKHVAQATP